LEKGDGGKEASNFEGQLVSDEFDESDTLVRFVRYNCGVSPPMFYFYKWVHTIKKIIVRKAIEKGEERKKRRRKEEKDKRKGET
jgi:hypothetical protein